MDNTLKKIEVRTLEVRIKGISQLVQHQWSEKAKRQIAEKQAGKKTKNREPRDAEQECNDAAYRTIDGKYGIPVTAIKSALISAAHKDLGIEKTLLRKGLFLPCSDPNGVLPMDCGEPTMRTDLVRVGMGTADIRYRPSWEEWGLTLKVKYDATLLREDDILNLINRAGFGVGVGENRPEKGGEWGRFEVVED